MSSWTFEENKMFEVALAHYYDDLDNVQSWITIAGCIPGKTVADVLNRYKQLVDDVTNIEAGLVAIPEYITSGTTSESIFGPERERKRGVPWSEDEHRRFLIGLQRYGKGNWKKIATDVTTRTPTQVASHAQKYFARQLTGGKENRRSSIHDITTVNVPDANAQPTAPTTLSPTQQGRA